MTTEPGPDANGLRTAGKPADELILSKYLSERSPAPTVAVKGSTHIVRYVKPPFCILVGRARQDLIDKPFVLAVPDGMATYAIRFSTMSIAKEERRVWSTSRKARRLYVPA